MALYSPTQNWEQGKKGKIMSRTVCSWCKAPLVLKDDILVCGNTDCPACDEKYLHEELIRTRKALEQSEICCTEWEKQALDYKAENIALSGDLERTRKVLDKAKWWLNEIVESHRCTPISTAEMALKEITALDNNKDDK